MIPPSDDFDPSAPSVEDIRLRAVDLSPFIEAVDVAAREMAKWADPNRAPRYVYDPAPSSPHFEEGATSGWLVMRLGTGSRAFKAKAVVLTDSDGVSHVEQTGDWEETTVVDDA